MIMDWQNIGNNTWISKSEAGFVPLVNKGKETYSSDNNDFPFDESGFNCKKSGYSNILSLPLEADEKLYGLGLNFQSHNLRENVYELKVDHYSNKDTGHTHAPVPFYVSSKGYGVFINVSERIKTYMGTSHPVSYPHPPTADRLDADWNQVSLSHVVEIMIPGDGYEIIIFKGETMLDVVQKFNMYCGGGCMPPKWGLGFWYRTPIPYNAKEVVTVTEEFENNRIPLQVIGLEPGWQSSTYPCTYEFGDRFTDIEKTINNLSNKGIRLNLWENCMVHPESEIAERLSGHTANYFAGWGGFVPDFADSKAREIFADHHLDKHIKQGISGYKLDECDGFDKWVWPDHAEFPSGMNGTQIRQQYGVLYQKMFDDLFRNLNQRTYGLVRASNAGAVSYPFVIYNDCYEHREFITGLVNGSFSGLLFTPEARGSENSEEWLRRIQATCMSPLAMLNAWADDTTPWSFPEVTDAVRRVIELRIKLIPYLYSAFAKYRSTGKPPFRALILEGDFNPRETENEQGDLDSTKNPYSSAASQEITDQYMMGESMMICPLFAGEASRQVVLPSGRWYDFYTGRCVGEEEIITISSDYQDIPIFVREGAVIPLLQSATFPEPNRTIPLIAYHYGEKPGSFDLYDDDGETFAYENGNCSWQQLKVEKVDNKWQFSCKKSSGNYQSNYEIVDSYPNSQFTI